MAYNLKTLYESCAHGGDCQCIPFCKCWLLEFVLKEDNIPIINAVVIVAIVIIKKIINTNNIQSYFLLYKQV